MHTINGSSIAGASSLMAAAAAAVGACCLLRDAELSAPWPH